MYHVWWTAGDDTGHYVVKASSLEAALQIAKAAYPTERIGRNRVVWNGEELSKDEGILLEILDWC